LKCLSCKLILPHKSIFKFSILKDFKGGKLMQTGKKFWQSKTFWVNAVSIVGIVVQSQTGFVVPVELQAALLGVINAGLRLITKEPIV